MDKGTGTIIGANIEELKQYEKEQEEKEKEEKQETAQRIYDTFLRGSYK